MEKQEAEDVEEVEEGEDERRNTRSSPAHETPPRKNVTVEFVLPSVLAQLYASGKPHKKRESL